MKKDDTSKKGDQAMNQDGEKAHDKGFYRLIPRGKEFQGDSTQTECRSIELQKTQEYRKRLLDMFGYKTKRRSDYERVLYLKVGFILRNAHPHEVETIRKVLKILVADQDLIFNETDRVFRSRMLNGDSLSENKAIRRALNGADGMHIRRNWINRIVLDNSEGDISRADMNAQKLLTAIVEDARVKRRTVYDWLYSKQNIAEVTENNKPEYEEKYRSYPDGYYDKEKRFPTEDKEQQKFIMSIVKKGNPYNIWLLDLKKCTEIFKELLKNENTSFISEDFSRDFICRYLARYIKLQQSENENLLGHEDYCDQERICANFERFREKERRLEELEKEFFSPLTDGKYDGRTDIEEWGFIKAEKFDEPMEKKIRIIAKMIEVFWGNLGIVLNASATEMHTMKDRIRWVLVSPRLKAYKENEKPILLLSMVLSCWKRIKQNTDVRFSIEGALTHWRRGIDHAKQRLEEIKLLHQIHIAFGLSWGDQAQNWEEYFIYRDVKVCSIEEFQFWSELLHGEYEKLPHIGFQICFITYVSECIPVHYETLSYSLASKAHLGGYQNFLNKHLRQVEEMAMNIKDFQEYQEYIERYWKKWNDPKNGGEELQEILTEMLPEFQSELLLQQCPDLEMKLLVLETALRMCIRERAKEKLYNWYGKAYNYSLRDALYRNIY